MVRTEVETSQAIEDSKHIVSCRSVVGTSMTGLAERAERELSRIVSRYSAGEGEVVCAFLVQSPAAEEGADVAAFREIVRHPTDPFEAAFVRVMCEISVDEFKHGASPIHDYVGTYILTDEVLQEAKEWLARFLSQRLRMRNEMSAATVGPATCGDRQRRCRCSPDRRAGRGIKPGNYRSVQRTRMSVLRHPTNSGPSAGLGPIRPRVLDRASCAVRGTPASEKT